MDIHRLVAAWGGGGGGVEAGGLEPNMCSKYSVGPLYVYSLSYVGTYVYRSAYIKIRTTFLRPPSRQKKECRYIAYTIQTN